LSKLDEVNDILRMANIGTLQDIHDFDLVSFVEEAKQIAKQKPINDEQEVFVQYIKSLEARCFKNLNMVDLYLMSAPIRKFGFFCMY